MPDLDHSQIERLCAEIEALAEKATEGEWFVADDPAKDCPPHRNSGLALIDTGRMEDFTVARLMEWHNAAFIAASRTAVPALVGYCRQLMADRAELMKVARAHDEGYREGDVALAALPPALLAEVKGDE